MFAFVWCQDWLYFSFWLLDQKYWICIWSELIMWPCTLRPVKRKCKTSVSITLMWYALVLMHLVGFSLTYSLSHFLTLTLSHTNSLSLSPWVSLSISHSLSPSVCHFFSLLRTQAHKHTNTLTQYCKTQQPRKQNFFFVSILRAGGSRRLNMQAGRVLSDQEEEEYRGFVLCFLVKVKKKNLSSPCSRLISTFQTMFLQCKWFCAERSRHSCVPHFSCTLFLLPKSEFMHLCALELLKRLCNSGGSWICCVAEPPQGCNISASVLCVTAHLAKSRATDMEITDSEVDEDAHR